MQTEPVSFYSDGLKLQGAFFLPDDFDASQKHSLVIPCSGFTGLMKIHPARFARYLTSRGYMCFGFDYRGFAGSEGERGRVILDEQVRDIIHATSFAEDDPRVNHRQIILLGWGMGAGLVIDAARELVGALGLICVNGFYSGKRIQLAHRGPAGYLDFHDRTRRQYTDRAKTGKPRWDDPFFFYPLDQQSQAYVDNVLRQYSEYDTEEYSGELADSLLRWHPEAYAPYMRMPVLIAHATRNALHPHTEAESLYHAYGGPKELFWIYDAGHTEWMKDDDYRFLALGRKIYTWLEDILQGT
ncbi:MAG: alpha/beta hydrolase [Dehalococcoidia bacterium]